MNDRAVSRPRRIARPDAVLHGVEVGTGPTVLLLHAGGERRRVWDPVSDVLVEAGFRCVAFDQRGHGDSGGVRQAFAPYADDVATMVRAEPAGCVVVGASLGGLAAIAALDNPAVRTRVAGLVLVDVVPGLEPQPVRRFLASSGILDTDSELVDDIFAQVPRLLQITPALDLPVLLVRGGNRSPVTDADVDRLLRLVPHATVTRIPSAGHLVARDQPVALADAIAAVTTEWPALALLGDLGAAQVDHPGGNLLEHLRRVRELTADWGANRRVSLAALCHAAYGTDGFPPALLPLEQRNRLRAAIGEAAESLVYRYDACDRSATYTRLGATPLPLHDRFTGKTIHLAADDLSDFAVPTIANELDIARTATLSTKARRGIRELVAALAVYVPDIATRALADPALRAAGQPEIAGDG